MPTLLFGLLVGWEIDWGRQVVRVPFVPPPLDPKPVTPLLLPEYAIEGGLVANGETVSRTLFNATRRPAPALAGEGGPYSLKPGQFLLLGTALGGEHNMAFLKEVAGGKSRTVREGDKINGMLVAAVTAERVKLTLGDESEELVLKVAKGPKTTLAPPPAPPVAAAAGTRGSRTSQRLAARPSLALRAARRSRRECSKWRPPGPLAAPSAAGRGRKGPTRGPAIRSKGRASERRRRSAMAGARVANNTEK